MSWWLLLPLAVVAFLVFAVRSARAWRARFRGEFLAYLRREAPEFEVVRTADMAAVVRRALDERSMNVMKTGDTYDAARILLVPGCLKDGEEIAAAIPDRDTLILMTLPPDGDWSGFRKLAKTPAGDPLWPEPLRLTTAGLHPVP